MRRKVRIAKSAERELKTIPSPTLERIAKAIATLANDPHPSGCRKLAGGRDSFRVRIESYRVVYQVAPDTVTVLRVAHRASVYRR